MPFQRTYIDPSLFSNSNLRKSVNITVKLAWLKDPRKAKLSAQNWWTFYFDSSVLLHFSIYFVPCQIVKFYLFSFIFCPFPVHCYQLTYFNRFSGWDFIMTSPLFHVWHRMFAPFDSTLQILNNEPILALPCQKVNECFPIVYKYSNISEYQHGLHCKYL